MTMVSFEKLYFDFRKDPSKRFVGELLVLDPGETTGWCHFSVPDALIPPKITVYGQISSNPLDTGIDLVQKLIKARKPTTLVYEEYQVYDWKSASHSWSTLHTPKLIGAIRAICQFADIPMATAMAQQAKQFVTDEKLHEWGFWVKGQKHCRDSIRHALLYLLFNHKA